MANQAFLNFNINDVYLSADAVTLWMHGADHANGDGNGQLSIQEVVAYLNVTLSNWSGDNTQVTAQQMAHGLRRNIQELNNMAHYQIYYIIGEFLMNISSESNPVHPQTYTQLVTRFNDVVASQVPPQDNNQQQPAAPVPPPQPAAAPGAPCRTQNFPDFPNSPPTVQDCRNCDDNLPITQEAAAGYAPADLMMLPSGNCASRDAMNHWIQTQQNNHRAPTDPTTNQRLPGYGGGRKRKSRKSKKSKKTRNKKSKKTKKTKKTRKHRR